MFQAGYVHFPGAVQSDVKVLMMLYSKQHRQFMGLIPNEQAKFMAGIKQLVSRHRQLQAYKVRHGVLEKLRNFTAHMFKHYGKCNH